MDERCDRVITAVPVELNADLARALAAGDPGNRIDGWTVAANTLDGLKNWSSLHTLVIRNEAGEHFARGYECGLTERQTWDPWEGDTHVVFDPVERQTKVVEAVEWVKATPTAIARPSLGLKQRAEQAEASLDRVREAATTWHRDARSFAEQIDQKDRPEWVMVAHVCAVILAALDGGETNHTQGRST